MNHRSAIALLLLACGGKPAADNPALSNTRNESCTEKAAAMKTWMRDLFEGRPVAVNWVTGDAALDAEIERTRVKLREAADPSKPAPRLSGKRKPGPIDRELESCPAATEQLAKVGNAWTSQEKLAAWTGIADAIETCECGPRIGRLQPMFYILLRGPD